MSCINPFCIKVNSFLNRVPCFMYLKEDYYTSSVYFNQQSVKSNKKKTEHSPSYIIYRPNSLESSYSKLYEKYPVRNNGFTPHKLLQLQQNYLMLTHYDKQMALLTSVNEMMKSKQSTPLYSVNDDQIKMSETTPPPLGEIKPSPSAEDLDKILQTLSISLERFFVDMHPFELYHQNIIFENNMRGTRSVGIARYMYQAYIMRIVGHFKFAYVNLTVLKITKHPEDNTIRCRWRVQGIPGYKVFVTFWQYKLWKMDDSLNAAPVWIDGFSIFHVGSDGLIYKHVLDKMQPDDDKVVSNKSGLSAKLAMVVGALIGNQELYSCSSSKKRKGDTYAHSDYDITLPSSEKVVQ